MPAGDDALFFGDEVEFFDPAGQDFSVNFFRKIVTVVWSLEVQFVIDSLGVELPLPLSTFTAHPLESVVAEELFHLFALLFVLVSLERELGYFLKFVLTRCQHQHLVLVLQLKHLVILFFQLRLQTLIEFLELLQAFEHALLEVCVFTLRALADWAVQLGTA